MPQSPIVYIPRLIEVPPDNFFLLGPRGAGKSTWLQHEFPKAEYVNLLLPDLEQRLRTNPSELETLAVSLPPDSTLILDEIQRVPTLLPLVHDLIERRLAVRFVLTGSSIRKLRRANIDLLGGRAVLRLMFPFVASELGAQFSIERALQFGLMPSVWTSITPADRLKSFVSAYLREEVLMEGFVRRLGDFHRFAEVASFYQGQQFNTSEVTRQAQVSRKTADGYLQILYDLLLAFELPVFTRRGQRPLVSHPKFFYFDCGVYRVLRPSGPLDEVTDVEGPALETLVAQHLQFWVARQSETCQFAYWRTRSGLEVDFVVYGPKGFWALDVANSTHISRSDLKGLKAFKEDYPECTPALLHMGKTRSVIDGIQCMPVDEFLLGVTPAQPLLQSS